MSYYTVYLEGEDAERLRELAQAERRRPRSQAEILLEDAVRRAGTDGDTSLVALVAAFEAEGQKCFRRAGSSSTGLVRSLVLQARGEAWLQAATRLRAAVGSTTPIEARTALPADDRPTAA
jgi:hypothetical protein